jgi:hypothetical protein
LELQFLLPLRVVLLRFATKFLLEKKTGELRIVEKDVKRAEKSRNWLT